MRIDRASGDATYGYPNGGEGTYYMWAAADLEAPLRPGGEELFGLHAEVRARERTRLASFYDGRLWLQEGYLFADVGGGRLSVGKLYNQFGLKGDGTWWYSIPYYDGLMLDPDWGLSFTRTLVERPRFTLAATAQAFLVEDGVNGSAAGADAESDDAREEGPRVGVRLAPTWTLGADATLAAGLSARIGSLTGDGVPDDTEWGVAVDATLTLGGWSAFGAIYLVDGVRNATHYVTGGPSTRLTDVTAGVSYTLGPIMLHACWSGSWIDDPDGEQSCWIAGVTVALLRKVNLYFEYVDWTAQAAGAAEVTLEDGFQVILEWTL